MELTPDQLGAGFVGLVIVLGAMGQYLRSLRASPAVKATDPVLAGIAVAFGDREQGERLITVLERCAKALEALADKRADEMEEMQKALLERLDAADRRAEQEEQKPRRQPARRR